MGVHLDFQVGEGVVGREERPDRAERGQRCQRGQPIGGHIYHLESNAVPNLFRQRLEAVRLAMSRGLVIAKHKVSRLTDPPDGMFL